MDTNLPWVAVVDDEAAIRRAVIRLLRSAGIEARGYDGGGALLAALQEAAPDAPYCVVLDLNMPGMSGFELQARLATAAPRAGVVAVTGHHSEAARARVLRCDPVAYLMKPMDDGMLLGAIASARAAWNAR